MIGGTSSTDRCARGRRAGHHRSPDPAGDRSSPPGPAPRSHRQRRRPRRRCARGSGLTSMNFITGSVHVICRFTASWFGNIRCARLWLTMTTFSESLRSASLKSRPAISGTPARRRILATQHGSVRARILFTVDFLVALAGELGPVRSRRPRAKAPRVPTATRSTPGNCEMRRIAS